MKSIKPFLYFFVTLNTLSCSKPVEQPNANPKVTLKTFSIIGTTSIYQQTIMLLMKIQK